MTTEAAIAGFFQLRFLARGHAEYGPRISVLVVADILISCAFVNGGKLLGESFCAMSEIQRSRFIRFRSGRASAGLSRAAIARALNDIRALERGLKILESWPRNGAGVRHGFFQNILDD